MINFNNINELHELIKKGYSNEDIIKGRLSYLNSAEYKSKRKPTIKDGCAISFHDGFISADTHFSKDVEPLIEIYYTMDETQIYSELINLYRDNMDKNTIPYNKIMEFAINYFKSCGENTTGKAICEKLSILNPYNKYTARKEFPFLLDAYQNSSLKDSCDLVEFCDYYIQHLKLKANVTQTINEIEMAEKYRASMLESTDDAIIVPISTLKGSNIAACTEYSAMLQNCLSFLGVQCYMIGGFMKRDDHNFDGHNYNIISRQNPDGNTSYYVIDAALRVKPTKIEGLNSIDNLNNIENFTAVNTKGSTINYTEPTKLSGSCHMK